MAELRRRKVQSSLSDKHEKSTPTPQEEVDSMLNSMEENSMEPPLPTESSAKPAAKSKYRNWWIRLSSTFVILSLFASIIWSGPSAIALLIIFIQLNAFNEIISIGYRIYKLYELPRFRTICWYFLICTNYYFYGELIQDNFGFIIRRKSNSIHFFLQNHKMISYFMFMFGFIVFVLSLRKGYYAKQFFFFGWTTVSLLAVVMQSHFFIQNLMNGLVWIILPSLLVATNDSMAYICGFFWPWEKTKLIGLSPKKTWEGFIGGAFFTLILGWFIGAWFSQIPSIICPVEFDENFGFRVEVNCTISDVYKVRDLINVPVFLQDVVGRNVISMRMFQVHSCIIALFASLVAPFGGFFASGLKRAFKIKDFGDTIPGHGGFLDRFDCHYMIGTFSYVYLATFIRLPNVEKLTHVILRLELPEIQTLIVGILKTIMDGLAPEATEEFKEAILNTMNQIK